MGLSQCANLLDSFYKKNWLTLDSLPCLILPVLYLVGILFGNALFYLICSAYNLNIALLIGLNFYVFLSWAGEKKFYCLKFTVIIIIFLFISLILFDKSDECK